MSQATPPAATALTVVLVHGAFADASGWNGVVERLQAAGVRVTAPANPLGGISVDSAYTASVLAQIPGPVLAVGHSYGGAAITNAATSADNVVGLVYIAAFAPTKVSVSSTPRGPRGDSVLTSALVPLQYPTGQSPDTAVELAIKPDSFHDAFAADLPAVQTAVMAALSALSPSWRCPSRRACPPGKPCPPGPWSPLATRPPVPMSSVPWPPGPGLRSPKPRVRT